MAVNPALFERLAEALSQPSKTYKAVQAGLGIPASAMTGYEQGADFADKIRQRKLAQQTLNEALGGNVPERIRPYKNLTVPIVKDLGGLKAIADITEDPMGTGDYLTTDQAKQFGLPDEFISSFGGRPIKREVAQGFMSNKTRSQIGNALQKRTELQLANVINRNVNMLTSGTGALSTAGKNNLRINRVKSLLERPTPLTPQEMELVTTDLAGVVQGGVPLKDTVEGQAIATVSTKIANILKQITNNPAVFNDAGFRSRIIVLANEMIEADNDTQDKALKMVRANFGHLTTPEHLAKVEEAIRTTQQLPIIEPGSGSSIENMSDEALRAIASGESQ